jgi:hypothetical protein
LIAELAFKKITLVMSELTFKYGGKFMRSTKRLLLILAVLLWATITVAQWSIDPAQNLQILRGSVQPEMISDGAGGAIVVGKSFTVRPHLYAQRVDRFGRILWSQSLQGIQVSNAGVQQNLLTSALPHLVVPDGAGGAYVAFHALWVVGRYPEPPEEIYSYRVYIQHLDANGNLLWGNEGLPVFYRAPVDTGGQALVALLPDDAGGIYVVFGDGNHNVPYKVDWYVHRFTSAGTEFWGGLLKLPETSFDADLICYSDGAGGICMYGRNVEYIPTTGSLDRFRRISPSGELVLDKVINISAQPDGLPFEYGFVHENGVVIFVWRDSRTDSVRIQKLDRDGNKLWSDTPKFIGRSWAQSYIFFFNDVDSIGGCYLNYPSSTGPKLLHIQNDGNISWENKFDAIALLNMGSVNAFGITAIFYPSWYLQKFDLNGSPIWPGDGVLFTIRQSSRGYPLTTHGSNGIIVAWDESTPLRGIWMQQISYDGKLGMVTDVDDRRDSDALIKSYQLYPNYPNPFKRATTFVYETRKTVHVKLTIYDVLGSKVIMLINEDKPAGKYRIDWNAHEAQKRAIPTGIYFARFKFDYETQIHKLVLIR